MTISAKAHACETCGVSYIRPRELRRHRCRVHGESTPKHTAEFTRRRCGELPPQIMKCRRDSKWLREKYGIQPGCRTSEGPGLRLADFLAELIRHAPRPAPVTRTTDATTCALQPDPGCCPLG